MTAGSLSPARARQVAWVVGEIHAAAALVSVRRLELEAQPPGPEPQLARGNDALLRRLASDAVHRQRCTWWLVGEGAAALLELGASGALRARGPVNRPCSPATQRVRASVLRNLAARTATAGALPAVGNTTPAPWTPDHAVTGFLRGLARDPTELGARTSAVAHLAACGLRVGEQLLLDVATATSLTTGSKNSPLGPTMVVLARNPPGPSTEHLSNLTLDLAALKALRKWLKVRETVAVSDRVQSLYLTLRAARSRSSRGPALQARGLPVSLRALHLAHNRAAARWLSEQRLATEDGRAPVADLDSLAVKDLSLTRLFRPG